MWNTHTPPVNCRDSVPGIKDHSACRLPGCGSVLRTGIAVWKTSQLQLCPNPANRKENHQISTESHCPRVRKHHGGDTAPGDTKCQPCFAFPSQYLTRFATSPPTATSPHWALPELPAVIPHLPAQTRPVPAQSSSPSFRNGARGIQFSRF